MSNSSALTKTCWLKIAWLAVLLLGATVVVQGLSGAENPSTASPEPRQVLAVNLNYQEVDYSIISWGVSFNSQSAPFKKEPAFGQGKVLRGLIDLGGNKTNALAFAWHRPSRRLYLDLNRNQDLTDDPAGVFTARGQGDDFYQSFTNLHLPIRSASGNRQFLVDLNVYDYGNRPFLNGSQRSFWQGQLTLNNQPWQVGIVENPFNAYGNSDPNYLLLRSWDSRDKPFTLLAGSLDAFGFPKKLFFQGQAFKVSRISERQGEGTSVKLQFAEEKPAQGDLKISGEFLQRVILGGNEYLAVLDQPRSAVRVPVGNYNTLQVRLKNGNAEAFNETRYNSVGANKSISVAEGKPATVALGGPLTNSVSINRRGKSLALSYQLVGVGGTVYQLANQDRSHPPEFTVYHANKRIGSGKFEFG